jgi:hypothetical protein
MTDLLVEQAIEHACKYDTKEGDPRRRFTQCQMETAARYVSKALQRSNAEKDEALRSGRDAMSHCLDGARSLPRFARDEMQAAIGTISKALSHGSETGND